MPFVRAQDQLQRACDANEAMKQEVNKNRRMRQSLLQASASMTKDLESLRQREHELKEVRHRPVLHLARRRAPAVVACELGQGGMRIVLVEGDHDWDMVVGG